MKRCFVIMPYGKRHIASIAGDPIEVNFDKVYAEMIAPGIERAGLTPHRSDHSHLSGSITKELFEDLLNFEYAIADISIPNPNVFYELGVRHALRKNCTLLIRNSAARPMRDKGEAPFDLNDSRFLSYTSTEAGFSLGAGTIANFLDQSISGKRIDSPIHLLVPNLRVGRSGSPLISGKPEKWSMPLPGGDERNLGVVAGALQKVHDIDVWVNSENTQFEMARFVDPSISSIIRYLGSTKKQKSGLEILGDEVNRDLQRAKTKIAGNRTHVPPCSVVATHSHELIHSPYHVKRIVHVASVTGRPMSGFEPVQDRKRCVQNVLHCIDQENALSRSPEKNLRSVLIPMLGIGMDPSNPEDLALDLASSVVEYFSAQPQSRIVDVYFYAYFDTERDLLVRTIKTLLNRQQHAR